MEEKTFRFKNFLEFTFMSHYKEWEQFIFGVTINKHNKYYTGGLYEDIQSKRIQFEINLWLCLISFHMTILGKIKKINLQ